MEPHAPPKLARKLLLWFLRADLAEEVEGDLEEGFYSALKSRTVFRAQLLYYYQVIQYLRPFAIRKLNYYPTVFFMMYRNYFKTALRNSLKNKLYAGLNIAGLTVGMTVALLIGVWVWDEVSFDHHHENYDRIARVIQNVSNNGEVQTWDNVPYPLAEEIRKNFGSDFEQVVMGTNTWDHMLTIGDKKLARTGAFFEPGLPSMLSLHMKTGSVSGLQDPSSVLLSASVATACFGSEDPINRVLQIDDNMEVKVAGVYDDFPKNSSFSDLAFIAPWKLFEAKGGWVENMQDPWRPNAFQLFVQLAENADLTTASLKIKDEKVKHLGTELSKTQPQLFLWPMPNWHLRSEFKNGINTGGRIQYVWLFGIIGGFVLLLACINFMNLCTARSEKRSREIGIRKSIGSKRSQLVHQFLSESFLLVIAAFVLTLGSAQLLLPWFSELANKDLQIPWDQPTFWLISFACCLITGLIAGSYPALYLSSFQPVQVLKGSFRAAGQSAVFRKALVVVQFTVSITLIIGTIAVYRQIQFAKDRPIGYQTNGLVGFPMLTNDIHKHFEAVRQELVQSGAIVAMAEAATVPTGTWASSSGFEWEGKDPAQSIDFPFVEGSHDYGQTIGWKITKGRDFSREFPSDTSALILNETAVRFMGLKDPVGATIKWFGTPYQVVGVVEDLVMQSPYEPVSPTVFTLSTGNGNTVIAKLNPEKSTEVSLQLIESVFKKHNPSQPFEYHFIDEVYGRKFGNEERVGRLATTFASLAIFISCLGIFGLASFVAEQRAKEVGIRKVMGATVLNVWQLLSRDFIFLVIISCFIALPIGYYATNSWLQTFTYRTEISWWVFGIAFLGAMSITLATVSFQAIKAAARNPVRSLKSE